MDVSGIFSEAVKSGASDIFVTSGKIPAFRINGVIRRAGDCMPFPSSEIVAFRNSLIDEYRQKEYLKSSGADVSCEIGKCRFRINFYETFCGPAFAARPVKNGAECTFERYMLPEKILAEIAMCQRGLVLISGSSGSGKSTTLNAVVNYINQQRNCHILTLEDPVEFVHEDCRSLISQRETVNISGGVTTALHDAMRENPDVIVVGEICDAETVSAAVGAALTGHLVLAAMHTVDAASTVERVVNMFPEQQRDQAASSFALALQAVVCQRLLPGIDGNRMVPAFEILLGTDAVRKYISQQNFIEIKRCLRDYSDLGMCAFNDSLYALYRSGSISFECAEEYSDNKEELQLMHSGIKSGNGSVSRSVYSSTAFNANEVDMSDLFRATVRANASDLLITAGAPPQVRVSGEFVPLALPPLDANDTQHLVHSILTRRQRDILEDEKNVDFAMSAEIPITGTGSFEERRFRINAFYQRNQIAMVARLLSERIPEPGDLGLPAVLNELMGKRQGFILITGPTGSGKSTTLASLLDHINRNRNSHIITIEDPIEYLHVNKKSIVEQRELGSDTINFNDGLRAALRQAPDIIMVGELRDKDTIAAALTAAETGHLVFGTLHSNNAMQTIERIIDSFPEGQQNQVRQQFAATVLAVVSQRLIPRIDQPGKRVAAFEVMIGTYAVRALIRDKKTHQLASVIESSYREGMITMQRSLASMVEAGVISAEDAKNFDSGS